MGGAPNHSGAATRVIEEVTEAVTKATDLISRDTTEHSNMMVETNVMAISREATTTTMAERETMAIMAIDNNTS